MGGVYDDMWWGYRHVDGGFQAKRFFDDRDLQDARESTFVGAVTGPFPATNRNDALRTVRERLG